MTSYCVFEALYKIITTHVVLKKYLEAVSSVQVLLANGSWKNKGIEIIVKSDPWMQCKNNYENIF